MSKRLLLYVGLIAVGAMLASVFQPLAALQSFAQPGCQTFKETGKQVCGRFLEYWQKNGALAQQGYPLSNEFLEVSDLDGKTYTVQYFERAVFEKHPENQPPHDVLLSQLGTFQFKAKYPKGEPPPGATPVVTKVYGFGEEVVLAHGIRIKAVEFVVNRDRPTDPPSMTWRFHILNNTGRDFVFQIPHSAIHITDDAGNNYLINSTNVDVPRTAKGNDYPADVSIYTEDQQLLDTLKYVELKIDAISGIQGPFVFRRHLQR